MMCKKGLPGGYGPTTLERTAVSSGSCTALSCQNMSSTLVSVAYPFRPFFWAGWLFVIYRFVSFHLLFVSLSSSPRPLIFFETRGNEGPHLPFCPFLARGTKLLP